jgi:hypothetical protein
MALRAKKDWEDWLSNLPFTDAEKSKYAQYFHDAQMTEDDLTELSHELLVEIHITIPGHRTKILRKAKGVTSHESQNLDVPASSSNRHIKSDVKLPQITKNCSPSQFRKLLIDWSIYKSVHHLQGSKCNQLLYCACDNELQNSVINGMPNFLTVSEKELKCTDLLSTAWTNWSISPLSSM